jgi:hypothetical protein
MRDESTIDEMPRFILFSLVTDPAIKLVIEFCPGKAVELMVPLAFKNTSTASY